MGMKYRWYPKIRDRDVHSSPTPRLGGIAMFVGVLAAFVVASRLPAFSVMFAEPAKIWGILGAAALIVALGVADDLWDLDWYTKLAGQIIAAFILAWPGTQLFTLPVPGGVLYNSGFFSLALTVFVVVLVMNAVNFIDGLDGLVAGVAIISNGVFFIYSYLISTGPEAQTDYFNLGSFLAAAVIGVCIGFLPLNWPPAKLFMGDSGALLIGLLTATSTIAVTGSLDPCTISTASCPAPGATPASDILGGSGTLPAFIPILLPFAVLLVPLLDLGLAALRRLGAGKSPFSADRKHLHHRLLDMGHSRLAATLIFYGWSAVASVGLLMFLFVEWWWALVALLVGFLICAVVTLSPLSRRKAVEAAVQSLSEDEAVHAGVARYDPLDAAAVTDELDRDAVAVVRARVDEARASEGRDREERRRSTGG
ncbi:MAG: undecaprenyl/decaprenyl-phosphate alpha-N-acetylglucosaminyl 1-phosphate transferase [Micrococcales bacterium]|nr:undecaprenyl/decaprenyl-phosphate alpha-N-acetylglucosaminyl 1-phosphate transferase [Micrococcales bacterium]